MAQKKVPMRQCIGCREMKPKRELIRVVKSPEGVISLDPKGKMPGRGTYICPQASCLAKARKSKGMERALSTAIPLEIYESLEAQLEAVEHG
ncbi:MAG: YlxR family protein [Oscillospiraceae bacterium]|nr:YlxR family protein [Oscillospiraceae bacterium]